MLDTITLCVLSITIVLGILRGFIKEVFGLFGLIISFIVTYYNHNALSHMMGIKSEFVATVISTSVVYIIVVIGISIVNSGVMYMLRAVRFSPVDRMLGVLTGLFKGVVLSFVFYMYMQLMYYTLATDADKSDIDTYAPEWMTSSKVYKPFRYLQVNLDEVLPDSIYEDIKTFGEKLNNLLSEDNNQEGSSKKKMKGR